MQLGETASRFYDNINGNLKSFPDATVANPTQFSFAAMGDPHLGSSGGGTIAHALALSKADGDSFVVVAGDDSNTGQSTEFNNFNAVVGSGGLPVYPAIGNHDIFFGGWASYKNIIGRSMYTFNAGTVHFIFLDTANGVFGVEQLNWLRDDLRRNVQPIKIVVMHFPIYVNEFSTIYKISSDEEATIFKSIMNQYGVQLVISGHYHGGANHSFGGTEYLVSGAVNNLIDIGESVHYDKVTINGTQVTTRSILF